MGLPTASSYFQQQIASILEELLYIICKLNLHDILISDASEVDSFYNLRLVFQRLRRRKVNLNPKTPSLDNAARYLASHTGRYGTSSFTVKDGGSQFVKETMSKHRKFQ